MRKVGEQPGSCSRPRQLLSAQAREGAPDPKEKGCLASPWGREGWGWGWGSVTVSSTLTPKERKKGWAGREREKRRIPERAVEIAEEAEGKVVLKEVQRGG